MEDMALFFYIKDFRALTNVLYEMKIKKAFRTKAFSK
jgi:hypothetical protein